MGTSYQIEIWDPLGTKRLVAFNPIVPNGEGGGLEVALAVNGIGRTLVDAPRSIDVELFPYDSRIEVWRQIDGGRPYILGNKQFLLRRRRHTDGFLRILGLDSTSLLKHHYVLYDSESSEADKNDQADDMMKSIVLENMGNLSGAPRDLSAYLTVAPYLSLGPTIRKEFAWRNVFDILREIADSSATNGTYLAFDIVRVSTSMWEFRTYTGQRGIDHRFPGGQVPVLLSEEQGSLSECELIEDAEEEATHITALGRGIGAARLTATASDSVRIGLSPFGRREHVRNSAYTETPDVIQSDADDELRARRPHISFSCRLNDTRGLRFDEEYGLGDFLTASMEHTSYDCRLDVIHLRADHSEERIDAVLRAEL